MFQSTYLYKVRQRRCSLLQSASCFNPRTYIRYDFSLSPVHEHYLMFQSTYLYKVRQFLDALFILFIMFQSTYLYKVRLFLCFISIKLFLFQSTYLYKVRHADGKGRFLSFKFQSTYLYKVRLRVGFWDRLIFIGFNPRTYIRYDVNDLTNYYLKSVSIHVPI